MKGNPPCRIKSPPELPFPSRPRLPSCVPNDITTPPTAAAANGLGTRCPSCGKDPGYWQNWKTLYAVHISCSHCRSRLRYDLPRFHLAVGLGVCLILCLGLTAVLLFTDGPAWQLPLVLVCWLLAEAISAWHLRKRYRLKLRNSARASETLK
jgi:uncharacterized protein (DUF983 family)